jgi:hypothetical protein
MRVSFDEIGRGELDQNILVSLAVPDPFKICGGATKAGLPAQEHPVVIRAFRAREDMLCNGCGRKR